MGGVDLDAAIRWSGDDRVIGKVGPSRVHLFTVSRRDAESESVKPWLLTTELPGYGRVTGWPAESKEEATAFAEQVWVKWLAGVGVVARELGVTQ